MQTFLETSPRQVAHRAKSDGANETRSLKVAVRAVKGEAGKPRRLVGVIPFDSESEILCDFTGIAPAQAASLRAAGGCFREKIAAGAFQYDDVRCLIEHRNWPIIGRTSAQTFRVEQKADGLHFDVDVPGTVAGDELYTAVDRGDIAGVSFDFAVRDGGEAWDFMAKPPVRTLRSIGISEISFVGLPAYSDSAVATRRLAAGAGGNADAEGLAKLAQMREEIAIQEREAGMDALRDVSRELRNVTHAMTERAVGDAVAAEIGEDTMRGYSILRAIRAVSNPAARVDGLEGEVSAEIARRCGRNPRGLFVPLATLAAGAALRALTTTTGVGGLKTSVSPNPIELLRPLTITGRLGATLLSELIGTFTIPRQTAGTAVSWTQNEGDNAPAGNAILDGVSLSPSFVSAYTDITRGFLAQSSVSAEAFARDDIFASIAVAIDKAAINGSGASGEPTGILNTVGLATVSSGTNGGDPNWESVCQLVANVENRNVGIIAGGFASSPIGKSLLSQTPKAPVASGGAVFPKYIWSKGAIGEFPAVASNVVPSNLTKGSGTNLSPLIFGNWRDLLIGIWGAGVDLVVDPYTLSRAGAVRVVIHVGAQVKLRHLEAFAAIKDIDTSSITSAS